jgi:hypothetical protein
MKKQTRINFQVMFKSKVGLETVESKQILAHLLINPEYNLSTIVRR